MANKTVAGSHPIRLEKNTIAIAGHDFKCDAYLSASELTRIFGHNIPVPVATDGTASVRVVARHLRRLGIQGLRAMRDAAS